MGLKLSKSVLETPFALRVKETEGNVVCGIVHGGVCRCSHSYAQVKRRRAETTLDIGVEAEGETVDDEEGQEGELLTHQNPILDVRNPSLVDLLQNLSPREQREIEDLLLRLVSPSNLTNDTKATNSRVLNDYAAEILKDPEAYANNHNLLLARFREVSHLANSTQVNLCDQRYIHILPTTLKYLQHLTSLKLCCNHFTRLPREMGYLQSLKSLSINRNKLTHLPETFGLLQNLRILDAGENQLVEIPETLGMLKKLETLILGRNQITHIPTSIAGCESLVMLDVGFNPLACVPAEILTLKMLRRVEVSGCSLMESVPSHEEESSPPTLKEIAARSIILFPTSLAQTNKLATGLNNYLQSYKTCSACSGPCFEHHFKRYKLVQKFENTIPLEYVLCRDHWRTEAERVRDLFSIALGRRGRAASNLSISSLNLGPAANGEVAAAATSAIELQRPALMSKSSSLDNLKRFVKRFNLS